MHPLAAFVAKPGLGAAVALVGLFGYLPSGAQAATIEFSGTQSYVNILNPPGTGRCAPAFAATVDIEPGRLSSSGTSNLGNFASTQSHCIVSAPPTSIEDGIFSFAFEAGDLLTGTYTGEITESATPDLFDFDLVEEFLVTGGTGRFLNATGTLTVTGSFIRDFNPQGPGFVTDFNGSFRGLLDLQAIPEPATWATMIFGLGLVGQVIRRRRTILAA